MLYQPSASVSRNDRVMTPPALARRLTEQLQPYGLILEPAAGNFAFVRVLRSYGDVEWCEITRGRDFFDWTERVDWIVTNPPYSIFRSFLIHAMSIADHVALLITVNHWWTKRRVREVASAGFGYERLILVDTPPSWPSTGFQHGMMVVSRGYTGELEIGT